MDRVFVILAALLLFVGVGAGAFGAHGLRGRLDPDLLQTFQTGVQYHVYHALGLFAIAWAATRWPGTAVSVSGWLVVAGVVLFSGSLYLLALTGQRWLGAITPLGGLAFLGGWLALAWAAWRA
jgi:uncharacterized membrane protein YgdD (TMEM256/DUF423 family)